MIGRHHGDWWGKMVLHLKMTELVDFWWQHVQQDAHSKGRKTLRELLEAKHIVLPRHALQLRWYVGPAAVISCSKREFLVMQESDKGRGLYCTEKLQFGDLLGFSQGEHCDLQHAQTKCVQVFIANCVKWAGC